MDCKSLLEVIPITQTVSVVDESGKMVAYGEASVVAMRISNCVLEKRVQVVRVAKSVGNNNHIEIRLGGDENEN